MDMDKLTGRSILYFIHKHDDYINWRRAPGRRAWYDKYNTSVTSKKATFTNLQVWWNTTKLSQLMKIVQKLFKKPIDFTIFG